MDMKNLDWGKLDLYFFWTPLGLIVLLGFIERKYINKHYEEYNEYGVTHRRYIGNSKIIPVLSRLIIATSILLFLLGVGYLLYFKFIFAR